MLFPLSAPQMVILARLPPSASLEEGALVEPLAVGVSAVRRGELGVGDAVLVCGAGPVGLLVALLADHRHVASVTITGEHVDGCANRSQRCYPSDLYARWIYYDGGRLAAWLLQPPD